MRQSIISIETITQTIIFTRYLKQYKYDFELLKRYNMFIAFKLLRRKKVVNKCIEDII